MKSDPFEGAQLITQDTIIDKDINSNYLVTGAFTDSRDGKTYKTIKIGTQIWMAENFVYKSSSDCWAYDNDETNLENMGVCNIGKQQKKYAL